MFKKILLPINNSGSAERAGQYAIASAGFEGADIIVLNVVDTNYLNSIAQSDLREKLDQSFREEGKEAVERYEKKIEDEQCAGNCKNIKLITLIKEGKPEDVIIKTAIEEDVDEIIMGKSGKEKLERFIVGSTTERVVRGAEIPVIVVP
ncbi:MAG: universal stress protein [Methanobacterium sp.]|nr:universal stress protein [Methanobacterium sp.]